MTTTEAHVTFPDRPSAASTTQRTDLLIQGATVLTVDPTIGELARADILVRGDTIVAVGPDVAAQAHPDARVIDAGATIAIPGFVDAHLHAWEGQLRGTAPSADFAQYLGVTAFGFGPRYEPRDNYAGTMLTALAALDAGITTVIDNGHNALTPDHAAASVEALLDAGIRAVHAVGSPFGAELEHIASTAVRLRERNCNPLLSIRLFDINPTAELWRFAKDNELWVSTELGPHTPELTERLEALHLAGLLTPEHAFNHCYDLTERAWQLIAASGAAVNLCPRSDAAYGLGSTVPPVDAALRHAAAIGLSNDNETSYGVNMFAEMQTLSLRHRSELFRDRDADGQVRRDELTPERLLEFATLGGARNAGLADAIGSLTPGKQADIVLIRADSPATWPAVDATATVTSIAHPGTVDTVVVAGRVRKRHGHLVDVDLEAVHGLATDSRRRLISAV